MKWLTLLVFLVIPAFADGVACASGSLASIDGTTCDIGNLQFAFNGLQSVNTLGVPWTDSDFTFTVLSNGFELSGPPAQTIPATTGGQSYAQLAFGVTDLTGPPDGITDLNVSGGNLSVSGPNFSRASTVLQIYGPDGCSLFTSNDIIDSDGTIFNTGNKSGSATSAPFCLGFAAPFAVFAEKGNTASIDGTTADFTFTTGPAPPPTPPSTAAEPRFLMPLSIGILGLVIKARRIVINFE
jgi:hypothetical protein